jgi:hypothetical protein
LAKSSSKALKFWVINPLDEEIYEMIALKKGNELIEINGQKQEAINVHWTLDSWKSMFWGSDLWYRKSDGILLRQGINKGPGSPMRIKSLVSQTDI